MNVVSLGKAFNLIKQLTDTSAPTVAPVDTPPQKPAFAGTEGVYESALPESEGIPSAMLCEYINEVYCNKNINIHNLVIARHGRVLVNIGFDAWDTSVWRCVFSQSKSITSIAVGMLLEDGLITLNTTLAQIFGKRVPALYKSKAKELTVFHLLTMSSGADFNELQCITTDNWLKGYFTSGFNFEPGEKFNYNSLNTYVLSAAVSVLTGKSMVSYLEERLFDPLGITDYFWEKCPKGADRGGWGLYIKPLDMMKIGQMMMDGGVWQGKRILSEKYVRAATTKRIDVPAGAGDYDYGFQIWTARDYNGFLFNGMFGQNMFCFNDSGIIVCVNSGNTDIFQRNDIFAVTHKYFNRPFPDTLPRKRRESARLARLSAELGEYRPRRNKHLYERLFRRRIISRHCNEVSGVYNVTSKDAVSVGLAPVLMQVVLNNYTKGTVGYGFGSDERGFYLDYREATGENRIHIGFDKPAIEDVTLMGESLKIASVGEFRYNEDDELVLKLRVDFLEYPFTRNIKFIFKEDRLEAVYRETPGREMLDGINTDGIAEKLPAMFSSLTQAGAEQIITRLGNAFERNVYAIKNQ